MEVVHQDMEVKAIFASQVQVQDLQLSKVARAQVVMVAKVIIALQIQMHDLQC